MKCDYIKKTSLNLKMWLGILSLAVICVVPEIRKLAKVIPLTIGTSILRKYRQATAIYRSIRSVQKKGMWVTRQVLSGNGQMVKDLVSLQLRAWVVEKYGLGSLKSDSGRYILSYRRGDSSFKIYFPKVRRPTTIMVVTTPEGKDVTTQIIEALGPGRNFHGIPTSPKLLGFPTGIKVEYNTGVKVHVLPDELINPRVCSTKRVPIEIPPFRPSVNLDWL